MFIIKSEPFENGGYPPIQSWSNVELPDGYYVVSEELDTAVFYEYNGFVFLTIDGNTVTKFTPNTEAWEDWKASLPEPPEPETDDVTWDSMAEAITEGVNEV